MVALRPGAGVTPDHDRIAAWRPLLEAVGLILDCVTEGANCSSTGASRESTSAVSSPTP
jgi:hypothetical protein